MTKNAISDNHLKNADLRQRLLVLVLGALLAIVLEGLDAFGLSSMADRQKADQGSLVDGLWKSAVHKAGLDREAFEPVTVLLIDPTSRERLNFNTPYMPYSLQAEIVRTLAAAKPKAVFIDYIYRRTDDLAGMQALADAVTDARLSGVPVYSGPISEDDELLPLRKAFIQTAVSWQADGALQYPLLGNRYEGVQGRGGQSLMAASRIYADSCEADRQGLNCSLAAQLRGPPRSSLAPVFLTFTGYTHPSVSASMSPQAIEDTVRRNYLPACVTKPAAQMDLMAALARHVFRRLSESATGVSTCLSVPHYALGDIELARYEGQIYPNEPLLQKRVSGKFVMVGDGLGNDVHEAPVFGQVNGVFLHALALQALLGKGDAYTRWPGSLTLEDAYGRVFAAFDYDFIFELFISLSLVFVALVKITDDQAPSSPLRIKGWVRAGAFSLPAVLAVIFVLAGCLRHWPLLNITGILLMAGGLFSIAAGDAINQFVQRKVVLIAAIVSLLGGIGLWYLYGLLAL